MAVMPMEPRHARAWYGEPESTSEVPGPIGQPQNDSIAAVQSSAPQAPVFGGGAGGRGGGGGGRGPGDGGGGGVGFFFGKKNKGGF
jgi:hypothetical protein